jgi:hypothetical protein
MPKYEQLNIAQYLSSMTVSDGVNVRQAVHNLFSSGAAPEHLSPTTRGFQRLARTI